MRAREVIERVAFSVVCRSSRGKIPFLSVEFSVFSCVLVCKGEGRMGVCSVFFLSRECERTENDDPGIFLLSWSRAKPERSREYEVVPSPREMGVAVGEGSGWIESPVELARSSAKWPCNLDLLSTPNFPFLFVYNRLFWSCVLGEVLENICTVKRPLGNEAQGIARISSIFSLGKRCCNVERSHSPFLTK
ncbi:hypothetical protein COLO4_37844 [Corchorus olitorius]|uniref:Uncharacterized protein n=1 Tax=Corchorus olitorius TaxID=93759 RepID=A0A1R3FYW1_9ROSI|nr:hypothetical protein COLO4_37844 [Corchorus olitorius]